MKRSNEIAPKDKDEKKKMDNLLSAADASESSAIQFAAKNRRKGVVAILLGATKTKDAGSDDVGVSDKVCTYIHACICNCTHIFINPYFLIHI